MRGCEVREEVVIKKKWSERRRSEVREENEVKWDKMRWSEREVVIKKKWSEKRRWGFRSEVRENFEVKWEKNH